MRTLLAACCLTALGCGASGPALYPVTGRLSLKDGRPVAGAVVEFAAADGSGARGRTDPAGRFVLETGGVPGAAAGPCRVAVVQMVVADGAAGHAKSRHAAAVVHPRYAKFATSGLTREVKPAANEFDIVVEQVENRGGW